MENPTEGMQAEPQRGKDLNYLTIYPRGYDPARDYPLILMLHGFGANMYDLASLAQVIDTDGYIYVCPNAPMPVQLGPGMLGFAWTVPGNDDPEAGPRSERKLEGFWQEVMERFRVPPRRTLLMGFSQGGGLTYRCGLPRPDLFAGLAALSCSIREPEELRGRLPAERNQPVFIAHGLSDNVERARSSQEFLAAEGYTPFYREYQMGHEISQEVLADLVPWIKGVLPPLSHE